MLGPNMSPTALTSPTTKTSGATTAETNSFGRPKHEEDLFLELKAKGGGLIETPTKHAFMCRCSTQKWSCERNHVL